MHDGHQAESCCPAGPPPPTRQGPPGCCGLRREPVVGREGGRVGGGVSEKEGEASSRWRGRDQPASQPARSRMPAISDLQAWVIWQWVAIIMLLLHLITSSLRLSRARWTGGRKGGGGGDSDGRQASLGGTSRQGSRSHMPASSYLHAWLACGTIEVCMCCWSPREPRLLNPVMPLSLGVERWGGRGGTVTWLGRRAMTG